MNARPHIAVCICTYRRPEMLHLCLQGMIKQETGADFTYSVVVCDNDEEQSARLVVASFDSTAPVRVEYCLEPVLSIARARNKALAQARGQFVAFFDDDQVPTAQWLRTLLATCIAYSVDGVLAPVKPRYVNQPPDWVIRGKFCERATYPTGHVIKWREGRTGNTLLRRDIFPIDEEAFRPVFITGEDQDFFRRMIEAGYRFVWCSEAVVDEIVPATRWNRRFLLRRALLRGKISLAHPSFGAREVVKSVVAVPAYIIALPFARLAGKHRFVKLLVSLFDHLGKLLAVVRLNWVSASYAME